MNTTTLNMTTLDGGVIIKKGTAPAPPSGGESGGLKVRYFKTLDISDNFEKQIGVIMLGAVYRGWAKSIDEVVSWAANPMYMFGENGVGEGFSGLKQVKAIAVVTGLNYGITGIVPEAGIEDLFGLENEISEELFYDDAYWKAQDFE